MALSFLLLALAAAGMAPASAAEASAAARGTGPAAFLGPLRLRDMTPFSLQRLDFLPTAASARYPENWALEANLEFSNTFIMSRNVADYLEARGTRAALTGEDFAALAALPDDAFYFDGTTSVLNLTVHRAINDDWTVYGILPLHHYTGGFLDSTIESFHDAAGFDDFGRPLVARDAFQAFFKLGEAQSMLTDVPRTNALADPVIGGRWRGLALGDWDVVVELAAKLPWGADVPFFSSGHADTGVQVSWQRLWSRDGLFFSVSGVYFGGSDNFGKAVNRFIPGANVAWEHRIADNGLSSVLQLSLSRSLFAAGTDPELAANQVQLSAGLRWQQERWHFTFALTENVINFANTADIGFHAGLGWSL